MAWEEFYEVAEKLSHDLEKIETGQEVVGKMRIKSPTEAANILSRATPEQRSKRAETFFDAIAGRQELGQGMHDRGEAISFAYGEMRPQDTAGINRHFPIRVKTISIKEKEIVAGTCWDVSTRSNEWGVDDGEELYCIVNIGKLILHPGASLIVRGNVFALICQELQKYEGVGRQPEWKKGKELPPFDIGVLPTPFSYTPENVFEIKGRDGSPGKNGSHGAQERELEMTSTIFGPIYTGKKTGAICGKRGQNGKDGEKGSPGGCGGASKLAEINIRNITCGRAGITILAKAGDGGKGGDGGNGGNGGNGSNGLPSYRTLYEDYPAGVGGDGGNGGVGGKGGNGGNGGISSNIYICVPKDREEDIHCIGIEGYGGSGGSGGMGGRGGTGGSGTPKGKMGENGSNGKRGRDGHIRPAPPVFLNEKRII